MNGAGEMAVLPARPARLKAGDRVRFVSPASTPGRALVERGASLMGGWGLEVEVALHAFDRVGHYLAGTDDDRLADLNDALRNPSVRAVVATSGGKGAYRIADRLDFEAARADPKPVVGYSETTILHLALWKHGAPGGFHGPHAAWVDDYYGDVAAESLRRALMEPEPVTLEQQPGSFTAGVVVDGRAEGVLLGGQAGAHLRPGAIWGAPLTRPVATQGPHVGAGAPGEQPQVRSARVRRSG